MLNYKRPVFWASITVSIIVSVISISFDACKKPDGTPADPSNQSEVSEAASSGISETVYTSEYSSVKISFDSENSGFKLTDAFEATDPRVVAYIGSTIRTSISSKHIEDPEKYPTDQNNSTEQYTIKLSNKVDGYSCGLYYDDLYDMACIEKDGGYFDVGTDFARYIDSLFENTDIDFGIDKTDAVLFKEYGWTLDYRISEWKNNINDINLLCDFDPNAYYFAYNNELSKDIGLDMSRISGNTDIEVEIYRIRESMPQEFYPIKTCRGIVVKTDGKIIGAFIIAGWGNMLYACSLKGNSFESVTGKTIYEWLAIKVKADSTEESLSELEPELINKEYFMALDNKDANGAAYCISKKTLMENQTINMSNTELFNEVMSLLLTDADIGAQSTFENLKSAKLSKIEVIEKSDKSTGTFMVYVDLQYNKLVSIENGKQFWICSMVYESPQTGWKIESFGH